MVYTFAMLKAVVFDFDGVIVDSEPLHYAAFRQVVQPLGVDFSYDEYLHKYIGFDDRDCFRAMLYERSGVRPPSDAPQIVELVEKKLHAFEAVVEEGIRAMPGAVELIAVLGQVVPLAIASGAGRADIDLICRRLNIADYFSLIVSADDVAHSKPDPQSYRLAVQKLAERYPQYDIEPAHCLAIEDTEEGLKSAVGAGLMTLAVTNTLPADRLTLADRIVQTLQDIEPADLQEWFSRR